jgi:tetratricopeptide (TPR) repeat protein
MSTFELGKGEEHVEDQPADRGSRVQLLADRDEGHLVFFEQFHEAGEVEQGAAEAIDLVRQNAVDLAGSKVFEEALQGGPYALRRRAWVCTQLRQHDQAEADYRRALEIDPEGTTARLGLAQMLLNVRKNHSEASQHFERLWSQEKSAAVVLGLAQSWRQIGRGADARHLLADWLKDHAGDAAALAELGRLALDRQAVKEAEELLRRALALAPYLSETYYSLYLCLSRQGRTAEAKECEARMEKAKEEGKAATEQMSLLMNKMQASPDDPDLRCEIAQIFLRYGEEEGLRWLLLNVQKHPGHRQSHLALADYYDKLGQTATAAEHRRLAGAGSKGT